MGLLRAETIRAVVDSNVSNLASFAVANDGLTLVQNDLVGLFKQTTSSQCGVYICGAVGGGTCTLTRAYGWESGIAFTPGLIVRVGAGTNYGHTSWMTTVSGTIGTNDPAFYPRSMTRTITLSSGTYTMGSTEKLWILSTTTSVLSYIKNTLSGTASNSGLEPASMVAGKVGTASVIINAVSANDALATTDNSTYDITTSNFQ